MPSSKKREQSRAMCEAPVTDEASLLILEEPADYIRESKRRHSTEPDALVSGNATRRCPRLLSARSEKNIAPKMRFLTLAFQYPWYEATSFAMLARSRAWRRDPYAARRPPGGDLGDETAGVRRRQRVAHLLPAHSMSRRRLSYHLTNVGFFSPLALTRHPCTALAAQFVGCPVRVILTHPPDAEALGAIILHRTSTSGPLP
jgi:hypothetical protein